MKDSLTIQQVIDGLTTMAGDLDMGFDARVIMECDGFEFEIDKIDVIEGEVLLIAHDLEDKLELSLVENEPIEGDLIPKEADTNDNTA